MISIFEMHVSDESFDDNYALTTSSFGNSLKKKKKEHQLCKTKGLLI